MKRYRSFTRAILSVVFAGLGLAQPAITNIANAASNISAGLPNSGIAQGSIFIMTGQNLGPASLTIAPSPFQSASLSGTSISVTVGGTTVAPKLYYTSAAQVAALMPSSTPLGTGTITVTNNGQVGNPTPITIVQSSVGIFTVTSDGLGAGIVTYPDYSLVSPIPAANCGGVYTTCGAANPGDTLTIWATGMGPVSGNENAGAGLGVDMTNVDAKLWVGGVLAKIVFKGRGCCVGEDQIAFEVPDNVPTGCAVPMAIQIGNLISNYAVIAIAPKGSRTCTPSDSSLNGGLVTTLTTSTQPIKFGKFTLARQTTFGAQGQTTGSTDIGNAVMASFTVPAGIQPFIVSYLDDSPPGSCIVYNTPNLPDTSDRLANFRPLDGGTSINVIGPNSSRNVPLTGNDVNLGLFLSPGAYALTGTGGANVGSVNVPLTIPIPPAMMGGTNTNNTTVTRATTFNWTGGAPGSIIRIEGQQPSVANASIGSSFRCYVPTEAGTFTVPPSVTLALARSTGRWAFTANIHKTFTSTGLDMGIVDLSWNFSNFN